jgi:glutathione S-transferase
MTDTLPEQIKLVYFNAKGLAETSRLILTIAEIDYEDFRYPIEVLDWKTYNFKRELFDEDKQKGNLNKSMNKLPYLQVNDQIIPQSKSIERFLAKKFNLYGDNDIHEAQIDSLCEYIRDFKTEYQNYRKYDDNEREAQMNKWFQQVLPSKLIMFEELINLNYAIGNKLSLADIVIYSFITQFFDNQEAAYKSIEDCPKIKSIVQTVQELESIKNWIKNRPATSF